MTGGLIVDSFAGGGGASVGIERALGRPVDVAINHDPEAVAMHRANHPATEHWCQNIWQAHPYDVARGRPVDLAWFSPDCTHHSKAKGGRPIRDVKARQSRDLAWVVVMWAKTVRPRLILLENVEEFADWGPVLDDGRPCPERRGFTFKRWVGELRRLGYAVEWRELRACDYGAPTIRKRLYLVARCDGLPIRWPEPTHGPGRALAYRTAAEIIDWSRPCPSIFLTREEGRAVGANRPLAEATMRRIARGIRRYVLEAAEPFIVPITHTGDLRVHGLGEPLRTVTCANGGEFSLVSPFVSRQYGRSVGSDVGDPLGTVTAGGGGKSALAAVHLAKFRGDSPGEPADAPLSTVTANSYIQRPGGAPPQAVVAAFLAQHNAGPRPGAPGHPLPEPISTVTTTGAQQGLVAAMLSHAYTSNTAGGEGSPEKPIKTVTTGRHASLVAAFLAKYYGSEQDPRLDEALHTVTTRDRFGLVTVQVGGEPFVIVDIGMRMLTPRELFRAQGFPDDYVIDPECERIVRGKPAVGRLPGYVQIRCCGNSVCPPVAEALVRANVAAETAATEAA